MKKLLYLFVLLLFCTTSFSQWPINQNIGSDSTMVRVGPTKSGGLWGGLVVRAFSDTTAANLTRIRQYEGGLLFTTGDSTFWYRGPGATKWFKFGSNTVTSSGWNIGGNLFPVLPSPYPTIGTLAPWGGAMGFMTNSVTHLVLPDGGITNNDNDSLRVLVFEPTTKEMRYRAGNTYWGITGNSGTTAGTNFIGTTDITDFVIKTSASEVGRFRSTGGLVFKNSAGLDKIDLNKDGTGYLLITHRFGQGEAGSRTIPISVVITEDSASKKGKGHSVSVSKVLSWTDPLTSNPSSIEGANLNSHWDFAPRKGTYNLYTDENTSYYAQGIRSGIALRTQASSDSVARFVFYGSSAGVSSGSISAYFSNVTLSGSKQADIYGMVNGFGSHFYGHTQAGRYMQQFNYFAVGATQGATAGQLGTIAGLYIESLKKDSINRAWGVIQLGTNDYNAFRGKVLVGDSTQSATDSSLTAKLGFRAERGVNFPNIPTGKQALQLYVDGNGTVYKGDSTGTGGGTTYTFTNGLTESGGTVKLGGTLVENTTINLGGQNLDFTGTNVEDFVVQNVGAFTVQQVNGLILLQNVGDTIFVNPFRGNLKIDTLNYTLSTTGKKLLIRDTATGLVQNIDPSLLTVSGVTAGSQGQIYQTSNGAAAWKYDTTTLVTLSAGARFQADTAMFTDSTLYGSFYLDGNDTLIITKIRAVMNGGTSDTLGLKISFNDTINVDGTRLKTADIAINSTTTGNETTSFDNPKIPPGNWVWLKSPTVVAGRKPYHLSVSIIGYKKRVN